MPLSLKVSIGPNSFSVDGDVPAAAALNAFSLWIHAVPRPDAQTAEQIADAVARLKRANDDEAQAVQDNTPATPETP